MDKDTELFDMITGFGHFDELLMVKRRFIHRNYMFCEKEKDDYKSIASNTGATDPINYILGYQNTMILKAYNASLASGSSNTVLPVSLLADFSELNPAPANTTGWFIPSVKELCMLRYKDVDDVWTNAYGADKVDTKNVVNVSLGKVNGTQFGNSYYWSSSESETFEQAAISVTFDLGNVPNFFKDSSSIYVRAVCAY